MLSIIQSSMRYLTIWWNHIGNVDAFIVVTGKCLKTHNSHALNHSVMNGVRKCQKSLEMSNLILIIKCSLYEWSMPLILKMYQICLTKILQFMWSSLVWFRYWRIRTLYYLSQISSRKLNEYIFMDNNKDRGP